MRETVRIALCVTLAAACSACTVGPDFKPPHPDTPADFAHRAPTGDGHDTGHARDPRDVAASITTASDPDPLWWHAFHDPRLDTLIDRAIAGNLGLQEAVYRILVSREQEQSARAAGLPDVRATASAVREQLGLKGLLESHGVYDQVNALGAPDSSLNNFRPGLGTDVQNAANAALGKATAPVGLYQVGFDASWELDLFGRVRRGVEGAQAQSQAAVESRNDALVSLEAEVAQGYAQLRGVQAVRAITEDEIRLEQQTLDLVTSRQRSGLASQSQVESATAQLSGLQSQLPPLRQQIVQSLNGLALLVGAAPGTLDRELATPAPVPAVPDAVPVGLPSSLVRRRPDVRRAEAMLHAATANIGESIAQLFPDLSLTGQFGMRATQASYLTNWASHFFSFGPQISLPIFQGGALRAQVRIARAEQAAAVLEYRQAVLQALHDVDNALVVYRSDQERVVALQRANSANASAFDLARNGYRHGLVSFVEVLDAERQSAQSRLQLTQATLQVTTDLVSLYKALGGGWQENGGMPSVK